MKPDRQFANITLANLIARSAYQMGKTPLLPLFAAALGASDAFLGFIVSVSTLTGMVLKPFIGVLSDRSGRRRWLIAGTAFFALMPFTYWLVQTPEDLLVVRVIHGLATAIYGPVTLAYVTERWPEQKAERLGWFESARSAGYILGPALAGWLLLFLSPQWVFTIIGLISSAVFIPILALPETHPAEPPLAWQALRARMASAFKASSRTPAVWLSGMLEGATYIATYSLKAFLPVYALGQGINVAVIGLFFAVQEGVTLVLKPAGGRFGDRTGLLPAIALGMLVLGITLPVIPYAGTSAGLLAAAIAIGAAQALIFPSTTALIADQIHSSDLGAGMGFLGTFQNGGKVLGPVLGGLLIGRFDYAMSFMLLGGFLAAGAVLVGLRRLRN